QLQQTTKGVPASETLIHHLVQRGLKAAERTLETASERLAQLDADCRALLGEWKAFCKKVGELAKQLAAHEADFKGLTAISGDPVYVRQHLASLRANLTAKREEAKDC